MEELLKRLEVRHVEFTEVVDKKASPDVQTDDVVSPDTPNVLPTMMQLEQVKIRTKTANKVVLEVE